MPGFKILNEWLEAFKAQWPCHGIPDSLAEVRFEFAHNGDLVDVDYLDMFGESLTFDETTEHDMGSAMVSLSHDAQAFLAGVTPEWAEDVPLWWTSGNGRMDLQITWDDATSAYHQGRCDDDVAALQARDDIAAQLAEIDPEALRKELSGYGAWDAEELADHNANLARILWLACGDIAERPYQ